MHTTWSKRDIRWSKAYHMVERAYQIVISHVYVTIWYAYAYHIMHNICYIIRKCVTCILHVWYFCNTCVVVDYTCILYTTYIAYIHVYNICNTHPNTFFLGGGQAQLVSCPPLMLENRFQILMGARLRSPNAWMRVEEITSCKSHVASVSLTN